jgi:hypothetical protein
MPLLTLFNKGGFEHGKVDETVRAGGLARGLGRSIDGDKCLE